MPLSPSLEMRMASTPPSDDHKPVDVRRAAVEEYFDGNSFAPLSESIEPGDLRGRPSER
jgi:hypothetical protein